MDMIAEDEELEKREKEEAMRLAEQNRLEERAEDNRLAKYFYDFLSKFT